MKATSIKTIWTATKGIEGRTVIGIASVFGNVDDSGDRILRGSFEKTLMESAKRVRHLWQHGADGWDYGVTPPVATIRHLQEVGREALPGVLLEVYPEATGGLEVSRTYLETARGEEILACYKAGIQLEMSIGFTVIQSRRIVPKEQVTFNHQRDISEMKLFDTSDVNWGMNSATMGSKSLECRMALLMERLSLLRSENLAALEATRLTEFRALCAELAAQQGKQAEPGGARISLVAQRAEPAPVRISLTTSLTRLRALELAAVS